MIQKAFWVLQVMMIMMFYFFFSLIWSRERRHFPSSEKYSAGQGCAVSGS